MVKTVRSLPSKGVRRFILGDIGGTYSRLECVAITSDRQSVISDRSLVGLERQIYSNVNFGSFYSLLELFISAFDPVEAIVLGVAGPIGRHGKVSFSNLPWQLDHQQLVQRYGCKVILLNDFSLVGWGLSGSKTDVIRKGKHEIGGNRAYLGAGTGLGMGALIGQEVLVTEGGHCDFAPSDPLELQLLEFMWKKQDSISLEDVVSGPGLLNIYHFFNRNATLNKPEELLLLNDVAAERTIALFMKLYGRIAGNWALSTHATGGVYIAGGIAPKLFSQVSLRGFVDAFQGKGKMTNWLSEIPISLVNDPELAFNGLRKIIFNFLEKERNFS